MTYEIQSTAGFYKGSGVAVAAVQDGQVLDAKYTDDDILAERGLKADLASRFPSAKIMSGMMSCYQFTSF